MSIKGYKAFNRGMICKGKQYEENTTYEEKGNKICEAGVMHFCENPFDVLNYYPLIDEDGNISDLQMLKLLEIFIKERIKQLQISSILVQNLGLKGLLRLA